MLCFPLRHNIWFTDHPTLLLLLLLPLQLSRARLSVDCRLADWGGIKYLTAETGRRYAWQLDTFFVSIYLMSVTMFTASDFWDHSDLSSLTHSAWDSRIQGPSVTLSRWRLEISRLWAVVLRSHRSANSHTFVIFTSSTEESNLKFAVSVTKCVSRAHNVSKMCWRPNSAAPNSAEGAYSTPQIS